MTNISDKRCSENKNTHFIFNKSSWKSCSLWDNVEKHGTARQSTDDNMTRCMRCACWIIKATDTHSEYVTPIAFPRQQWLHERSTLRLFVHCLYCFFLWSKSLNRTWGPLIVEASRLHIIRLTQLVRLLSRSDQLLAEVATHKTNTRNKQPCP